MIISCCDDFMTEPESKPINYLSKLDWEIYNKD